MVVNNEHFPAQYQLRAEGRVSMHSSTVIVTPCPALAFSVSEQSALRRKSRRMSEVPCAVLNSRAVGTWCVLGVVVVVEKE